VLNELQYRFSVEVVAWREAIAQCQGMLRGCPFPSLWGASIVFSSATEAALTHRWEGPHEKSCIMISLDPHLEALAIDENEPRELQLPLFAAIKVRR
jgi:hypothetical protein